VASRDLVLIRVERHVFEVQKRIEIAEPLRLTFMDVFCVRSSVAIGLLEVSAVRMARDRQGLIRRKGVTVYILSRSSNRRTARRTLVEKLYGARRSATGSHFLP
jgi:hypothetical protein